MLLVYAYVDTYNKEGKAEIYAFTHSHSWVYNGPMLLLSSSSRYAYSWSDKICFQYDKEISFFFWWKLPCARERKEGRKSTLNENSRKKEESQNGINGKREENVYSKYIYIHKIYYDDVIWLLNWDNLFRKFIHCWRSSNREFISTLEIAEIFIHCQRIFCFPSEWNKRAISCARCIRFD